MRDIFKSQPVYTHPLLRHELEVANAQQQCRTNISSGAGLRLDGLYSCRHHRGRGVRYYLFVTSTGFWAIRVKAE